MEKREITRRALIKDVTGLQLGIFAYGNGIGRAILLKAPDRQTPEEPLAGTDEAVALGLFVTVGTDETVTVTIPRPDMGQGVRTSLAMATAEELEVAWSAVRVEQAPADSRFGSQTSGGSSSTRTFWTPMRRAGATARVMLVRAAAEAWGVDPVECRCEEGVVIHDASGRRSTYGELADAAARLPVPPESEAPLKPVGEHRLVGQPTKNIDNPAFIDGSAVFGADVRVPGMLFAAVARPHPFGGRARDYDDSDAGHVEGVRRILPFRSGVAVVAEDTSAAFAGRNALEITWDPGPNVELDDHAIRARLRERVGALPSLPASVATPVEAAYDVPYLAHATMEPMNCTADVRDGRCEIWAPTQAPGNARRAVARELGLSENQVTVNVTHVGGGFGRRLATDYATEAAALSREMGAPVQVVWSRDDDMRHDYYRPTSHHVLRGGLDADGDIVAFSHRAALASSGGGEFDLDVFASEVPAEPDQERPPYGMPGISVETARVPLPIPVGAWRSVNNTQFTFADESFMDELAAAGGHDPYALRRRLIGSERLGQCLDVAAEQSGWGETLPDGSGRGIACFEGYGTNVAQVVELTVSYDGEVTVDRVTCAVDCGVAVNPSGVEAQMEGAVVDGLSTALKAAITIAGGGVEQANFHDYRWLHIADMPRVDVHIVNSTRSPGGLGEPGFPAVSPAVANAVFAATGRRVRRLPIRPADLARDAPRETPVPLPTATPPPHVSDRRPIYVPWLGGG